VLLVSDEDEHLLVHVEQELRRVESHFLQKEFFELERVLELMT
jgi:hypothetical protein